MEYWVSWPRDAADGKIASRGAGRGASYESEAEAVAEDIARRVTAARREAEHTASGGTASTLSFRDFALLFRASTSVETYLQALRARGIPYEVQNDRKYFQRREVVDATALVACILDPLDQLALVTVMRSPLVGVPDAALMPLWEAGLPRLMSRSRATDEHRARVRAAVEEAARHVPPVPGLDRIQGWEHSLSVALATVFDLRASFRDAPSDGWVEALRTSMLTEGSEGARFLGHFRLSNLQRFFRDLFAALEERRGDVQSILRTLRTQLGRDRQDEANRPGDANRDAVQVLTMHGAKGLEFRHVYLVQLHKTAGGGAPQESSFERRQDGTSLVLFGAPSPSYARGERERAQRQSAERVRLLYVSMTRARDRLVLVGGWRPTFTPRPWAECNTPTDLLEHRQHAPEALLALAGRAAEEDAEIWLDPAGVPWSITALRYAVDPDTGEPTRSSTFAGSTHSSCLPSVGEIERQKDLLSELGHAALQRSARPISGTASEAGHGRARVDELEQRALARLQERDSDHDRAGALTTRSGTEREQPLEAVSRDAARAAGTALHRLLEIADWHAWSADADEELARLTLELPGLLQERLAPEHAAEALNRARELLATFAKGPLARRLSSLASHVLARELPVLLPAPSIEPNDGSGRDAGSTRDARGAPIDYVAGAVDLFYRDPEDGQLVVADYKTDVVARDEDLRELVTRYAGQGRIYTQAVQAALDLSAEPRFELWFLGAGHIEVV